jgi:hypothetical protein
MELFGPRYNLQIWTSTVLQYIKNDKVSLHLLHETLLTHYGLQSTRELCSKKALTMFLWTVDERQSNYTVKIVLTIHLRLIVGNFMRY